MPQRRIRKAVIPAAGLGTRFLPATKAIPKEMIPIVDVPMIQLIVEEAVASGIEEIILVTARGKEAIENHFDSAYELEDSLERRGKSNLAELCRSVTRLAKIVSVRQHAPLGLGHAVLCAKSVVGNEPFAVLLGDDLIDASPACTRQLIDQFEATGQSLVGVMEVAESEVCKYGMIAPDEAVRSPTAGLTKVKDVVEKPKVGHSPSRLAIPGRYVLVPEIFDALEAISQKPNRSGEIQLTDALKVLAQGAGLWAFEFQGRRYDAGDRLGYIEATIAYALKRPDLAEGVRALLRTYGK